MGSSYLTTKIEAYFTVGNLFYTLKKQDLMCLTEKYPGILAEYVNGLDYFINNEQVIIQIIQTIEKLLEKFSRHP